MSGRSGFYDVIAKWRQEAKEIRPEGPRMRLGDNRKDELYGARMAGEKARLLQCADELEKVLDYVLGEPL